MHSLALVALVFVMACSKRHAPVDNIVHELPIVDDAVAVVSPSKEMRRLVVLRSGSPPVFVSEPRSIEQLSRIDLGAVTTARPRELARPPTASQDQPAKTADDALLLPPRHDLPARVAAIELAPMTSGVRTSGSSALLLASRRSRALDLIEVLKATDSVPVVRHKDELWLLTGVLRIPGIRELDGPWIEVQIDTEGADIEVVPNKPLRMRHDVAAIAQAVRDLTRLHDTATVDVLVAPDIEVAALVGVLVALRVANPHVTLGIGAMPDEAQPARPGSSEAQPRPHGAT